MPKKPEELSEEMSQLYSKVKTNSIKQALNLQKSAIKGLEKIIKGFVGKETRGRKPRVPKEEKEVEVKVADFLRAIDMLQDYMPLFNKNLEVSPEKKVETLEDVEEEMKKLKGLGF